MIFCNRLNCEYNDDGACMNDNISLDDDGTCTDFSQTFTDYWEQLDDIEREEYNKTMNEGEDEVCG